MQNRRGAGKHGNGLRLGDESCIGNGNGIFAHRNGLEMELTRGVTLCITVNSELRALRITVIPGTGRCCGSCTMPRTLPKIVAKAPAAANRKTARTLIRFIFLLQWPNGLVRGQDARGASESTVWQDWPQLRRLGRGFLEEEREV